MSSHLARRSVDPSSLGVVMARLGLAAREIEIPALDPGGSLGRFDGEAALLVDGLLTRVARGRGALDVAVGERLADLAVGEHVLRLGYSSLGDYAREALGIAGRTAQQMMRLSRELRSRPRLRDAVLRGQVSGRRAVAVLPLARGEDEAVWVERARHMTVRELESAARDAAARDAAARDAAARDAVAPGALGARPADGAVPADEPWEAATLPLSETTRNRLDEALDLAGELLGPASPRWQRLEAICQEFLGQHPVQQESGSGQDPVGYPAGAGCLPVDDDWLDSLKRGLEDEMDRWSFLPEVDPVEAPAPDGNVTDPRQLDASLRDLSAMRDRWDELVGHLGLISRVARTWKPLGFASFSHYCEERLGLATRTVEQRIWLERRLHELPPLRDALRSGRLSYEKARIVAGAADPISIEACIDYAAGRTCIALRREVDAQDDAQMRARGIVLLRMPERVARLLDDAFDTARRVAWQAAKASAGPDECLFLLADHFVRAWEHVLRRRTTPARRTVERDRGLCQVPGCSRPAVHAHHVQFRSRGGSNDLENLVGVCAAHHLICIHQGWVRVSGNAPDGLAWELGEVARA